MHSEGRKTLFVTVGTTSFQKLTEYISSPEVCDVLRVQGFNLVLMQVGGGTYPEINSHPDIEFSCYRYKDSITDDIKKADLIISHAGAGSCLEALGAKKPVLVVINDELMGNHQTELAQELAREGYLYHCTCSTLADTLQGMDLSRLKPFEPGKPEKFAQFLDRAMGFS